MLRTVQNGRFVSLVVFGLLISLGQAADDAKPPASTAKPAQDEQGFVPIFDGRSLDG